MRALVKYATGPNTVELREVPAPTVGPGQILIDVAAVAICGTDRSAIEGGHDIGRVPRTLGHEVSGVVAAIGPDTDTALVVGDRVTTETDAYLCHRCEYCRKEEYQRCPYRKGIGTTADGGLADQLVMPALAVHRLPDNVTLTEAALTEPLAVSVHAVVEQSPSLAGQVVVVIGPGAIGQLCAQVARAVGATVVLVGRSRHTDQFERARRAGIPHTVDSETTDVAEYVKNLTGGYGAHSVYECSGAPGVLEGVPPMLRKGGRIVLLAFFKTPPAVDVDKLLNWEFELVGARGKKASSYRTALALMEHGMVNLDAVIGATLPLDEWEKGIELVGRGVKVVLQVRPENS